MVSRSKRLLFGEDMMDCGFKRLMTRLFPPCKVERIDSTMEYKANNYLKWRGILKTKAFDLFF